MPHQQIPEGWIDYIVAALAAVVGWFMRTAFGRASRIEKRVRVLEGQALIAGERHAANLERLERIDAVTERIDNKLDRLIEREGC